MFYGANPLIPNKEVLFAAGLDSFELNTFEKEIWQIYDFLTSLSNPEIFQFEKSRQDAIEKITTFLPKIDWELLDRFPDDINLTKTEYEELLSLLAFLRDYERKCILEKNG